MLYLDFIVMFKRQVDTLSFEEGLDLAIKVCKRLYFDYESFVSSENWGDADLLLDVIRYCEQTQANKVENTTLEYMLAKVEAITPDTDDFGNYSGSCALNAAAAVCETLQFIMDKDIQHINNIGTYLTDTADFKIHENLILPEEQIDEHPIMIETRNFLLAQTKQRRTTSH